MINPSHSLLTSHSNEVWEKKKRKEKKKKELKPWLKLNQRKNICFFVTVATIPALKMTHLLLAGLPRWHIFCQLVFAAVTRNKKKKGKKVLNPWLKLNHRKNIYFFVTVATIPALKMTHLLLAGLPRWHIFCQLLFAAVTRNKCRYTKGSW